MYNTTPINAIKVLRNNEKDMVYTCGIDGNIAILDFKLTIPDTYVGKGSTMVDFFYSDLTSGISTETKNTFLTNIVVDGSEKSHVTGKVILGPNQSLNAILTGTVPTSISVTGVEQMNGNVINAGFLNGVLSTRNRYSKVYGLGKSGVTHAKGTLSIVSHKPDTNVTVWISNRTVNNNTTDFQVDKVQYLIIDKPGTVLIEGITLIPGESIYVLATQDVSANFMGVELNDKI